MASLNPSRAKSCSRRSFLRTVGVGGALVVGGIGQLPTVGAQSVEPPSIPSQFNTDTWERRELRQQSGGGYTWNGIALNNVKLAEKMESEVGYNEPLWHLYSWRLNAPLEDYADSGSSDEDDGGWLPFDIDSFTVGANRGPLFASVQLSNLGSGSDGPGTKRGEKALEIFGSQVESDYPFKSVTRCEGLQSDEHLNCFRPTNISYSVPTATVEEKYTIHKEYDDGDFEVSYRGLFVLQTFDESDSFVISGAMFPDSKVDKKWSFSDHDFDEDIDFVDKSRAFIKSAGKPS